jgi:hypothetical protein
MPAADAGIQRTSEKNTIIMIDRRTGLKVDFIFIHHLSFSGPVNVNVLVA